MINFNARNAYTLNFECITDFDKLKQSDVIGTLLTYTAEVSTDFNLAKLQNLKKIGKIQYYWDNTLGRGYIKLPITANKLEVSLLSSIIETIKKISVYNVKINLVNIEQSQKVYSTEILKRATEIYNTGFSKDICGKDLQSRLEELVNMKKILSIGEYVIGADFYDSETVYVVEGRRDVQTLANFGILNTIGVNGLNFNIDELKKMLEKKRLIAFFDADVGGNAIYSKLSKDLEFSYQVILAPKSSVEDLTKKEILDAISNKSKL